MADDQILNFIQHSRQTTVTDDQIRKSLLNSGWSVQNIQEAFDALESPTPESHSRFINFGGKTFKIAVLLVIIGIVVAGYFASAKFVFHVWPFNESARLETNSSPGNIKPIPGETNFATVKLATISDKYKATNPIFSPNGTSVAYKVQESIVYAEKKGLCAGDVLDVKPLLEKDPGYEKQLVAQYGNSIKKELEKIKTEENYELCGIERSSIVLHTKNSQVESTKYDAVNFVAFSPDGSRLVFIAKEKNKSFVVTEDGEGAHYDDIVGQSYAGITYGSGNVVFSSDSQKIAYVAKQNGKTFVVVDGKEGKQYDSIEYLTFSPDGKNVVYVVGGNGTSFVVVGDTEGKRYPDVRQVSEPCVYCIEQNPADIGKVTYIKAVTRPVFNPVTQAVAYTVSVDNNKWLAVIDNNESAPYDYIDGITFSPDGTKVFYSARIDGRKIIVENGTENKNHAGLPVFSPDGKRVAYVGVGKDRGAGRVDYFVNVDGKEGKPYFSIKNLVFSPDSKTVAYIARLGWPEVQRDNPGTFVVVGEKEGKRYDSINFGPGPPTPDTPPIFSPDGKGIAYYAELDQKGFVVVGDKEIREKDGRPISYPVFSQDSKNVAYGAWVGLEHYPASTELWWIAVPVN